MSHSTSDGQIEVSNIGGIDRTTLTFQPGLTLLVGENATNRTSLLRAINGGLGGTMARPKSDTDRGTVELELGGRQYTRELDAPTDEGTDSGSGRPIVDMVTLLRDNPVRRLIETGDHQDVDTMLGNIVMSPVDQAGLKDERNVLRRRASQVADELAEIEHAKQELVRQRQALSERERKLNEANDQIDTIQEAIAESSVSRSDAEEFEDSLREQTQLREKRNEITNRINRLEDSLESRNAERASVREQLEVAEQELASSEAPTESQIAAVTTQLQTLERDKRTTDQLVESAQRLIDSGLPAEFTTETLTDGLNPSARRLTCPLCESETTQGSVEDRLDQLHQIARGYATDIDELRSQRDRLEKQRRHHQSLEDTRDRFEQSLTDLDEGIERTQEMIEDAQVEVADVEAELETLTAEIEAIDLSQNEAVYEQYQKLTEHQHTAHRLETDIAETTAHLTDLEDRISDEEHLKAKQSRLSSEIRELNNHVERVEQEVTVGVTEAMDDLLELLRLDNIARVRVDRQPTDNPTTYSSFRVVVVRENKSGEVYEDDLTTLSEAERELVGLVVGIATGIAHRKIADSDVPVLLLDSLESFDRRNIDVLLEYVCKTVDVPHVIAALLPEDATAVSHAHQLIPADELAVPEQANH
ncbi:archaea-specific SMC-related protein [Natronosalvus vescus]|uniref:archaea-specific SMC-related protein n=1 Tax=Natronosalvus vescus TaxID=2953881 RepID=UPI0020914BFF|nr:archaea-specific SMC-related protein [Natronosalvus vescus]